MTMNKQSSKRTFDETFPDADKQIVNIFENKYMTTAPNSKNDIKRSTLEDLCADIFLEIFQYLHPMNLLYSLTNLFPHLDILIKPYTHTLDFRAINRSYFQCLTQSLLPYLIDSLRVLHLSNAYTFSQISDMFYKIDWSQINQIESLTLDSIQSDELSKYFLDIHPLLKHLWRLSLTFDEDDKSAEKLLIEHILIPTNQSLTSCFIIGITFDLNRLLRSKLNENLHELTLTLATINDLIILFRHAPHLEILICTILHSTCNESIDKILSLQFLTMLTITIQEPITFKNLQKILLPHTKIKQLSLQAILYDEDSSTNTNEEIGGLVLEKLFRTFSRLTELKFYLRHFHNALTNCKPNDLYLFSFTSHFWLDRSIKVLTHFVSPANQRYIYTLPFPFDRFHIVDDIGLFFCTPYPYYYANVRHLSLYSTSILYAFIYSSIISKSFPNIQTITLVDKPFLSNTIESLTDHQWILQRSGSDTSSTEFYPRVYIRNGRKSKHWYFQTLEVNSIDQRLFANASKRVRQLTIYKMTEQQTIALKYFFPWINVLILHVNTLEWFSLSNNWLYHLLINMTSLFSLTIYYPKEIKDQKIRDLLANTLLAAKKHFFIKCNNGIVNMWF